MKLYQPLHVLEADKEDVLARDKAYRKAWDTAMVDGDFHASVVLFTELQETYPDDLLYAVLAKQVQELCDHPPAADWDGVFNLRNK